MVNVLDKDGKTILTEAQVELQFDQIVKRSVFTQAVESTGDNGNGSEGLVEFVQSVEEERRI